VIWPSRLRAPPQRLRRIPQIAVCESHVACSGSGTQIAAQPAGGGTIRLARRLAMAVTMRRGSWGWCGLWVLVACLAWLSGCDGQDAGGALGGGPGGRPGSAGALVGTWQVTTTLVAASKATNPDYKPGHIRVETWRIASHGGGLALTSQAGTIPGQAAGGGFVFDGGADTGANLKIHVRVEGRWRGSTTIAGTIKVRYFGTFDNYVGLDAWTFEAVRR
jgi:hypothetical protein